MRPAGPLSSSPYNPRINKDRQWSSRDTQSTRCNFLYFSLVKPSLITNQRGFLFVQKAPLTVKVIFCLSGSLCVELSDNTQFSYQLHQKTNFSPNAVSISQLCRNKSHPPSYRSTDHVFYFVMFPVHVSAHIWYIYLRYIQFWVNTDYTSFQFYYIMIQTKKRAVMMWCYNQ